MLVVSVDKAPADFAMHSEKMIGTFWFYCEEYGVELK
jgi:hypothetical protein